MFRRLATIAVVLTLAACSDGPYAPTEVSPNQIIDDRPFVPREPCVDFAPATKALIPWCVEAPQ